MLRERIPDLSKYVEPDRVRRELYTDAQIFELEMQRIHEKVWIYCGHESQVPKPGDYYALQIGRHLVGDGGERVAHDLEGHWIELRHQSLSTEMMSSPVAATDSRSPGKTTVVEPYSLTSAGPTILAPAGRTSRR